MAVVAGVQLLQSRTPAVRAICPAFGIKRRWLSACDEDDKPKSRYIKDLKLGKPLPPMKVAQVFTSVWENPDCCEEQCEIFRHDIKFLKKTDRCYTRTWNECDDICKERWVCVGDVIPPEVEFRPRRSIVSKSGNPPCSGNESKLGLMKCLRQPDFDVPCPKIRLPGCKKVDADKKCEVYRKMECCQKRCTLYPSYSECKKPKPKIEKPNECACFRVPSMCEVYAMFRKYRVK